MDRIKSAALYPWRQFLRLYQIYLDKTVPHSCLRWFAAVIIASIFALRVIYLRGFYLVSLCLWIYVLHTLIMFMTPYGSEGFGPPCLPVTTGSDEFKPYPGEYTEFQLWYTITKAHTISIMLTFFSIFDLPTLPHLSAMSILSLLGLMLQRIVHMIKYKYVPFTTGKMEYGGKNLSLAGCSGGESLAC